MTYRLNQRGYDKDYTPTAINSVTFHVKMKMTEVRPLQKPNIIPSEFHPDVKRKWRNCMVLIFWRDVWCSLCVFL